MTLDERRLVIDAPPAVVYELITDAERLVEWTAPLARLEPRVGGKATWTRANGDRVVGEFLELVPRRRVVFTFGWERADVKIPPGRRQSRSSCVRSGARPPSRISSTAVSQTQWSSPSRGLGQ